MGLNSSTLIEFVLFALLTESISSTNTVSDSSSSPSYDTDSIIDILILLHIPETPVDNVLLLTLKDRIREDVAELLGFNATILVTNNLSQFNRTIEV